MSTKLTKEQREEALKKVAEVLDEAIAEYEMLEKMDLELAEDPTRPFPAAKASEEEEEDEKELDEDEKDEDEDEKEKDEDEKDEDKEEEMSDDAMKSEYAAFTSKMEARGLLKKSEKAPKASLKKSEEAPKSESLKKSMDDRFDILTKTMEAIAEKVEKIAGTPAPRKGVAGYQALKKSEDEAQPLNKAEVVSKLLDLKKSGNKSITSDLIMRIETNRVSDTDLKHIKGILG